MALLIVAPGEADLGLGGRSQACQHQDLGRHTRPRCQTEWPAFALHPGIENRIGRNPNDRQKMAILPPPAGKTAITDYEARTPRADASLVECRLHTGRTHQIRVHMKSLGTPILGDPIYARPARQKVTVPRLMLHAWKLGFPHPITAEALQFESPPPPEFATWL